MALIKCPECGHDMSDKAAQCPHCGFSVGEKKFCSFCGEKIDKECIVCPKCGRQVQEIHGASSGIVINNSNATTSSSSASSSASASASASAAINTSPLRGGISIKSRLVCLLLCIFLGMFGIHRFYVGKVGTGIIMFICMFFFIGEIWWIIDLIVILCGSFTDKQGAFVKNWM